MLINLSIFIFIIFISLEKINSFIFPNTPSFPNREKFYNINNIVFNNGVPKRINSLSDMNNDKHVDLVGENGKIWSWNSGDWKFDVNHALLSDCDSCHIISSDINYDGFNDLLVQRNVGDFDTIESYIFLKDEFEKNNVVRFEYHGIVANVSSNQQIAIFDNNSDMKIDIIGIDTDNKLAVWENDWSKTKSFKKTVFNSFSGNGIITPFSPLIVDIDGDCNADFVMLTCKDLSDGIISISDCEQPIIEFYINNNGKFNREAAKDIYAPKGIGRLTASDINRDGNTDLVFPVCFPQPNCTQDNYIGILYNIQIEMCNSAWFFSSNCRKQTDLCTREKWEIGKVFDKINLGNDRYIYKEPNLPSTVRISDWNMDGYPDFIFASSYHSKPGVSNLEIWNNVDCTNDLCQSGWNSLNRAFQQQTSGMEDVSVLTHVIAGFLIDLDERGALDLIVISKGEDGDTNNYVNAFFNNFHPDAFFFKNMGLNGVRTNGGYGAIVPGFTFKFNIPTNDITGTRIPRVCSQFISSNYLSLETPYCFFGLGRENGYIENFFMGAPVTDTEKTKYVKHEPGIIPNSQLICIPKPLKSPSNWELELFVSPTAQALWVALAVLFTLVLFGIPILFCWILEKHTDRKSKKMNQAMRTFL